MEARGHFTFKGKAISAFFLADFSGGPEANDFWTAPAGSRISAVVIQGLFDPMESYNNCEQETGTFIGFKRPDPDGHFRPWSLRLGYRFFGTTPSGITVLETYGNTGGSGTFLGVMLLRFEMETVGATREEKHDRLITRFLDEYVWGDRVYRDVKLERNRLWLGPARTDIPAYKNTLESERTILLE